MTSSVSAVASDPRRVLQRYNGRNLRTASGTVHALAVRESRGELFERTACHQGFDGEPEPTDAPITCRKPECRAEAVKADRRTPRTTAVGQTYDLGLVPFPFMVDPHSDAELTEDEPIAPTAARQLSLISPLATEA